MNQCSERLYNGLIKENPTFVLMLGMCPTLAVTTSAINGLGMGLSTTAVLVMSNMLISMFAKDYTGFSSYSVVYRNCGIFCNDCGLLVRRIYSVALCGFGTLYSTDRSKLYYLRTCRELRVQESGASVYFRWYRYGAWLYGWSYSHWYCS